MNMETRKVQRTGKSTLIVSLPKAWAVENAVSNGSVLFISQSNNGSLVLSLNKSRQDLNARIEIGNKSGDSLIRDIIACYIAGYRTIEVTSHHLSVTQKKDLHQIANKLIGPEILEETMNKIVIQDLLSSDEFQTDQALKRMKNVARSMIQDAVSALTRRDKELALDVMQRDNEVDRINLLIARQFMENLRSGSLRQETFSTLTAFNYMQAASNIERMADHASKIAGATSEIEYNLSEKIVNEITGLGSIFATLLDDAFYVILKTNSEKANELIDKTSRMKNQFMIDVNLCKEEGGELAIRLVVASGFGRMLDYIINIAEIAINMCSYNLEKIAMEE
jgi:phosphate uptake regulator